jgi:fibronectin-binding autotransporter adhesin
VAISRCQAVTLTPNGTSYDFSQFNFAISQNYSVTLDQVLSCVDIGFGGGVSGSSTTATWSLVGTSAVITASGNLNIRNTNGGTGAITVNGGTINLAGNMTSGAYAGASGTTVINFNGTGAQTYTKSGSGGNHGGHWTINKASGNLALTTAVTLTGSGQDVTITTGTLNLAGFNLTVTDVLTVDSAGTLLCNGGTVAYSSAVVWGNVACGTSLGITWTGNSGDHLFSTAGNWSNNNIPGSGDTAIFTTSCTGGNCDAQTTANTSVRGIWMTSGYVGTFTQSTGHTLSIGTAGYTQAAGTFAGGNATIGITSGSLSLSGGTFTSTSNTLTVNTGGIVFTGSPTFNHNSGTFVVTRSGAGTHSVVTGNAEFNNFVFGGFGTTYDLGGGTILINGLLTLNDTYNSSGGTVNNGTISAKGDVSCLNYGKYGSANLKVAGTANQSFAATGTTCRLPNLEVASTGGTVTFTGAPYYTYGNFLHTSGAANLSGTHFYFTSSSTGTYVITAGTLEFDQATLGGYALNFTIVGTMTVNGLLQISDTYASGVGGINGGTVVAKADVSCLNSGKQGNGLLKIGGSANQSISAASSSSRFPPIEIASTGGTVSLSTVLYFGGNFTYTSGTVNAGTSTALFQTVATISGGAMSFNHVTFAGSNVAQTISGTMSVLGTLTLADASGSMGSLNTGTILAYGDVVASSNGKGGAALIKVMGSGNQTISGISAARYPPIEIASTGGTVSLSGTLRLGSNYTYTSGIVDPGTSTVMATGTSTLAFGPFNYYDLYFTGSNMAFNLSSETISVTNSVTLNDSSSSAGALNSGTIALTGPTLSILSYGKAGNALIKLMGSGNQTISGGGTQSNTPNLEIASTGGTVSLSGSIYPRGNYTQTSGTVSAGTSTLAFGVTSTITPGTVDYYNVTFYGSNTIQNLNGGTMNVTGSLTLMDSSSSAGALNSGTVNVTGSVFTSSYGKAGNALIKLAGSTSQTISGVSTGNIPSLEIASTGGTVSAQGTLYVRGNYTQTSGTISHGTSTLVIGSSATIVPGTATYNNVTFTGGGTTYNLSGGTMTVAGLLTINDSVSVMGSLNSGTIQALGNVVFTGWGKQGSAVLSIQGNQNTTLSNSMSSGGKTTGTTLQIAKTGGATLTLASACTVMTAGQAVNVSSGNVLMNGFALTIPGNLTLNGNTLTKGGGALSVNGSAVPGTGSLFGGTVN